MRPNTPHATTRFAHRLPGSDSASAHAGQEPRTPNPQAPNHHLTDPLNPLALVQLAQAFGEQLVQQHDGSTQRPAVFMGTSTDARSDMVQSALQAGFNAAGVDTVLGGVLPVPAVAFITAQRGFQAGVAVAGSGQPFDDKGLRLLSARGERLSEIDEAALAQRMRATHTSTALAPLASAPSSGSKTASPRSARDKQASPATQPAESATAWGRAWPLPSAATLYTDRCAQLWQHSMGTQADLQGLSVVLDTAQGTAHAVAPALLERLGARMSLVGAPPGNSGQTGGLDTACTERLSQAVRAQHADIGIALDADGERLLMADAAGRIYGGDHLLYLLACDAKQRGTLRGGVVGTATSNLGLELALDRLGLGFARAPQGERALLRTLRQHGWSLGGSPGGRLLHLPAHTCSDALLTALQVLAMLQRSHQDLAQRCSDLQLYAQCQINVAVPADSDWQHDSWLQGCRERAENELGGLGRVLLHTCEREPLLRVMVECPDARRAAAVAMELAGTMGHARHPRSRATSLAG